MTTIERDFEAYLDEMNIITILIPYPLDQGDKSSFFLKHTHGEAPLKIINRILHENFVKYVCRMKDSIHNIGDKYWIVDSLQRETDLQIGAVTRTEEFDHFFYYDGKLGVQYGRHESTFALWAPTATSVKLKIKFPDDSHSEIFKMNRGVKGVWTVTLQGNVENYRYVYLVCVNRHWEEAVDPYAVAVTENGAEGVVIDLSKTTIQKRDLPPLECETDSIIYETHIRDFTIHPNSGVNHKGSYIGAAEFGTKDDDGNVTCLSYVKSLGITHLELMPLHDFEGVDELSPRKEYNWGYNPLHYNVPDGSYSLDPSNPYKRILELKHLIDTLHQHGIRVILDVVYNHVYKRETSSFEKIVPGYYFRHDHHGMPSNGTGVGNDIASERKMVRKFIVDSVLYWLNEYKVDGFRFDLMGILDIETMSKIREEVDQIEPSIILIGEGWDLNTPLPTPRKANIHNQKLLPRIGQFNDWFRDSIKGSTFNLYDKGFICGNDHYYDVCIQVMAGSVGYKHSKEGLFAEPTQSVNYVESHDNHTLWDKLMVCLADEDMEIIKKVHRLGTAIVLLSQGIPFLHSGQEFFRTKKGDGNSYRSPNHVNWLDWTLKQNNEEHIEYIKGFIQLRKSHRAFRLPRAELIRKHMTLLPLSKPLIGWKFENVKEFGPADTITIFINPSKEAKTVDLPEGNWRIVANGSVVCLEPGIHTVQGRMSLDAVSLYVLFHND